MLTAQAGEGSLCLYGSRITPLQRVVLRSEYLSQVEHSIRKTVLLQRYLGEPTYKDRRSEIVAALEKGEFDSDDQRRLAAQFRFSEAIQARFKTLHRDAYRKFQEAAELLQPLVLEKAPALEDAVLMYRACRALVETWLRQNSMPQAGELAETLWAGSRKPSSTRIRRTRIFRASGRTQSRQRGDPRKARRQAARCRGASRERQRSRETLQGIALG